MNKTFHCHKISEGQAKGEVLISADDFCFYLVDPQTGVVIERKITPCTGRAFPGRFFCSPTERAALWYRRTACSN